MATIPGPGWRRLALVPAGSGGQASSTTIDAAQISPFTVNGYREPLGARTEQVGRAGRRGDLPGTGTSHDAECLAESCVVVPQQSMRFVHLSCAPRTSVRLRLAEDFSRMASDKAADR